MTDWAPIAEDNPIEGDPWQVGALAHHFAARAGTIGDVISGLRTLETGEGEMVAEGLLALIEQRDDLIPRLAFLEARYDTAAGALGRYAPVLEEAQTRAHQAHERSWAAQREVVRLECEIETQAAQLPDPGATPVIGPAGQRPEDALAAARAAIEESRRLLEDAVQLRARGEATAADAIDEVTGDDLRNPRRDFFGSIGAGLGAAAGWVGDRFDGLSAFSDTLGMVSGALALAGFVFPPAGVAGAAVGALKLSIDVALMARGDGNWLDIATGAIAVVSFGVSRLAASAARASTASRAADRAGALQNTFGRAGALRGLASLSEDGVRLTGAAMRSNQLRRFGEMTRLFGDEAATAALPRASHALGRLRPLELPTRSMLDLCPDALMAVKIARAADSVETLSDAYDVGETTWKTSAAVVSTVAGGEATVEEER